MSSLYKIVTIGSTRIKWATIKDREIIDIANISIEHIESLFDKNFDLLVSVRPDLASLLQLHSPTLTVDHELACQLVNLENVYPTLGMDRLMNILGAVSLYEDESLVIIDFGTYTTVTGLKYSKEDRSYKIVDNNLFLGIGQNILALNNGNKFLPRVSEHEFLEYISNGLPDANPTEKALYDGIISTNINLLKSLNNRKIIITGGWANILNLSMQKNYHNDFIFNKNLIFFGGEYYVSRIIK